MTIKKEVKAGLFALVMVAALYWGVNFLKGRDLFNINNTYYATYEQVNGIQPSSSIVIKGFKVGTISNMSYDPTKSSRIILEFSIKSKYKIPQNSKARIFSDGIMGGKAVEIELGSGVNYLHDGDTLRSEMDKGFLEVAGSEIEFLKQRANQVVNEVMVTLGGVNKLLEQNTAHVNTTMGNLASISTALSTVISSEKDDLSSIINNLNSLSKTLNENSSSINNIIGNVEGFTDSLKSSNIPTMVDNLTLTLGQLNTTLAKVNQGEGTVGKFLYDEGLYDSLTTASGNLSRLLEDVKSHPGRYINISVFGGGKQKSK